MSVACCPHRLSVLKPQDSSDNCTRTPQHSRTLHAGTRFPASQNPSQHVSAMCAMQHCYSSHPCNLHQSRLALSYAVCDDDTPCLTRSCHCVSWFWVKRGLYLRQSKQLSSKAMLHAQAPAGGLAGSATAEAQPQAVQWCR